MSIFAKKMNKDSFVVNDVQCQPPFWFIKFRHKIGLQIGTRRITKISGSGANNETKSYPIVAKENLSTPNDADEISYDISMGDVWDGIELSDIVYLYKINPNANLQWKDFVEQLWYDHDRYDNLCEPIHKIEIYEEIKKFIKYLSFSYNSINTIHLHTEPSGCKPEVVCSARDDIFALNVKWTEDPAELAQRLVDDLLDYAGIISPNREARWLRMTYETNEERLQPLVALLNANPHAKSFKGIIISKAFRFSVISPYKGIETTNRHEVQTWNIDEKELRKHFKMSFMKKDSSHDDNIPILIDVINSAKTAKAIGVVALQIYESDYFLKDNYATFRAWYKDFCKIVGTTPNINYNKCAFIIKDEKRKKSFSFLKKLF